jgi:hypothetical protein
VINGGNHVVIIRVREEESVLKRAADSFAGNVFWFSGFKYHLNLTYLSDATPGGKELDVKNE